MKQVSIFIVDDHSLIRETFTQALSVNSEFHVVGNAGDSTAAIQTISSIKPDIVLLDINIKPLNGFEVLKEIKSLSPNTKVISVSMHENTQYAKKMIAEGASGYITKTSHFKEVYEAIKQCMEGKSYLCTGIKEKLVEQAVTGEKNNSDKLTDRELQIIAYVKEGLSSKQISGKMDIALKTVEVHRHNILRKLNLKNSASLMSYTHLNCL